jgi:hypothetical protein
MLKFAIWWSGWKRRAKQPSDGADKLMAKRHPNHRRVKIHRNYTVEDIALLFGTHKNTVRTWVKAGLPTSDKKRPMLILGRDLAAFLQARRTKNKRPCQPGEIYCVRCRVPKRPAGDMVDYEPITGTLGNLVGICPECDSMIYRRASLAKISQIQGKVSVTFVEAERQVSNRVEPTVNSDLE